MKRPAGGQRAAGEQGKASLKPVLVYDADAENSTAEHLAPKTYCTPGAQIMQDGELKARDLRVYLAIAYHADPSGAAWPSQRRIAELVKLSRQIVNRSIARLCARGHLKRVEMVRRRGGRFPCQVYRVVRRAPIYRPDV